ncbi:MAG: tight adherence protein [Phycisphaerales bacterium]|jgi:tight adherence protein C|nr:tight adherence protein [Phycisphaerales bacterium]
MNVLAMNSSELLLIFGCFGTVSMMIFFVARIAVGAGADTKLRDRLSANPAAQAPQVQKSSGMRSTLQSIGQAAAQPFMPKNREKQSSLRKSLGFAGIYSPAAVRALAGFKVILLVAGAIGGYFLGDLLGIGGIGGISLGGIIGYLAPGLWLRQQIRANQQQLQYGLADGLDLMVVCVEAGLTVDSAMQRVGQELMIAHPAISRELAITYMETRVGLSRQDALKNLGGRTGSASLQSLAAMLTQADRFGTSIAGALRIHADTIRQARQHAAEEMAAKASVKMSFPLVLFIFPATFIVLAGPTVIGLMNSGML